MKQYPPRAFVTSMARFPRITNAGHPRLHAPSQGVHLHYHGGTSTCAVLVDSYYLFDSEPFMAG
jgi:hypothetical protein